MKNLKKVLVVLVLAIMLVSVCACSYVPSNRFMSRSQVNSLVKQYDNPQAELILNYTLTSNGVSTNYEVVITYDLLLSQAPLAVIRFIQLANEGSYNNSVIDKYNSSLNYMILGRYCYKDSIREDGKKNWFVNNALDTTFKGEFKSNKYSQPKDGYAEFNIFSLAMYHEEYTPDNANFDTANGALILATDKNTLSSNNYAVFAHMVSMSYKVGDNDPVENTKVNSNVLANLKGFTSTTSTRKVYTDETEESTVPSFSMMNQIVTIKVNILGDYDWSKLPQIGR
ncbi:MAG: peptidylprolyl isomerase [Clostridiales bacterium]|nr:peptidylprolyl isomerase [Clostridiales bacterium]